MDINKKSFFAMVTDTTTVVPEHGKQCMLCSAMFSVILQTDILSTDTSDLLKQIIILKSFHVKCTCGPILP